VKVPTTIRRSDKRGHSVAMKLGDNRSDFPLLWCGCETYDREIQDPPTVFVKIPETEYRAKYRLCSQSHVCWKICSIDQLALCSDSDYNTCSQQRQCFNTLKQHAGCVVKNDTLDGSCVRLTSDDCDAMHISKQLNVNATKVCTTNRSTEFATLCHAVSSSNPERLNVTAIVKKTTACPEKIRSPGVVGERELWAYGIYKQALSDGMFCNYTASDRWDYMHHLSVLLVSRLDVVPFCFICANRGENITIWYSEDSAVNVSNLNLLTFQC